MPLENGDILLDAVVQHFEIGLLERPDGLAGPARPVSDRHHTANPLRCNRNTAHRGVHMIAVANQLRGNLLAVEDGGLFGREQPPHTSDLLPEPSPCVEIPNVEARFEDLDYVFDLGELDLNISGCMNACGHHHVGNIGILGVDKNDAEFYQVTLGGRQGNDAQLGKVIGPSFARAEIPDVIEQLIDVYLEKRDSEAERFIDVVWRIGVEPFKNHVYGSHHQRQESRNRSLAAA